MSNVIQHVIPVDSLGYGCDYEQEPKSTLGKSIGYIGESYRAAKRSSLDFLGENFRRANASHVKSKIGESYRAVRRSSMASMDRINGSCQMASADYMKARIN